MTANPTTLSTNPTIFVRLNQEDTTPREIAWEEFRRRYAPIIAGFARSIGARRQDIDDVIQDVLLGFFAKSPTFIYDSAKGRFRGYLKVCTCRALHKRLGKELKFKGTPLDQVDPEEIAIDQAWNDVWEQQKLRRALDELRDTMGATKTFRAFELYVVFDKPPQEVSEQLDLHINSVYRAKEQITRLLQEKLAVMRDED